MNDLFLRLVVLSLKSSLLLSFGEHGGWKVALPLGAIFKHGGCQNRNRMVKEVLVSKWTAVTCMALLGSSVRMPTETWTNR